MALRTASRLLGVRILSRPVADVPAAAATAARSFWASGPAANHPDRPSTADTSTVSSTDGKVAFTFEEPLDYVSSGGVVIDETLEIEGDVRTPLHVRMAERLDGRHFVATAPDAVLSGDSSGRVGGPGVASMADMVDVVAGAFKGEIPRVARAMDDLMHNTPGVSKPPPVANVWARRSESSAPPPEDSDILDYCLKNRARGGQI